MPIRYSLFYYPNFGGLVYEVELFDSIMSSGKKERDFKPKKEHNTRENQKGINTPKLSIIMNEQRELPRLGAILSVFSSSLFTVKLLIPIPVSQPLHTCSFQESKACLKCRTHAPCHIDNNNNNKNKNSWQPL